MQVTKEELKLRQNMSLQDKIDFTCDKIEKWYDHWKGDVYVAFSGGKDSLVLLDLVRRKAYLPDAKNIPAVYNDTGLEYPEIKEFVKTFDNVIITKPKLTYRQVIEKYGFPVISKEQSQFLSEYISTKSEKLKDIRLNGNKSGAGKISQKWMFMIDAPFKITHKCCTILKKDPSRIYERKTGRKGMIGSTVEESQLRKQSYLANGCNAYESKRPLSMPLAIWTEQDVLAYIVQEKLQMSSVYGEIQKDDKGKYSLTGVQRTGCIWCMYGLDREKGENRIQRLKRTHPVIWKYCINSLGLGDVMDFMDIKYE